MCTSVLPASISRHCVPASALGIWQIDLVKFLLVSDLNGFYLSIINTNYTFLSSLFCLMFFQEVLFHTFNSAS